MNEEIIKLIQSDDYRERFKGECYELVERKCRLFDFIEAYKKGELAFKPSTPIHILEQQLAIMQEYMQILIRRAQIEDIEVKYTYKGGGKNTSVSVDE